MCGSLSPQYRCWEILMQVIMCPWTQIFNSLKLLEMHGFRFHSWAEFYNDARVWTVCCLSVYVLLGQWIFAQAAWMNCVLCRLMAQQATLLLHMLLVQVRTAGMCNFLYFSKWPENDETHAVISGNRPITPYSILHRKSANCLDSDMCGNDVCGCCFPLFNDNCNLDSNNVRHESRPQSMSIIISHL